MTIQKNLKVYLVLIFSFFCLFHCFTLLAEDPGCEIDLFNERGYLKGNSYTSEASGECISDFNGNLTYTKTLLYFPGRGDLDLNLTLTYNGSINHTAQQTADPNNIKSMDFPECILGVNGVALQVFNFKTRWYVTQYHPNDSVPAFLVEGYDKSNTLRWNDWSLSFILADGSIEEYIPSDVSHCHWGKYIPAQVENFSVAWQESTVLFVNPIFKIRRTDGIVITYQEGNPEFFDKNPGTNPELLPHCYYPVSIEDRFGNKITFEYTEYQSFGRKVLSQITDACGRVINIDVDDFTNQTMYCDIYSPYTYPNTGSIDTRIVLEWDDLYHTWNNTGDWSLHYLVSEISEYTGTSSSRITTFEYEPYVRRLKIFEPHPTSVTYTRAGTRRLTKITHSTGDTVRFSYIAADDTVEIWEYLTDTIIGQTSSKFRAMGREPFIVNMVDSMMKMDSYNNLIRKVTFSYDWDFPGYGAPKNGEDYRYSTVKKDSGYVGLRPDGEGYSVFKRDSLVFRKFPVEDPTGFPYIQHCVWHTKLERIKNMNFSYYKRFYWNATKQGDYYKGTFLPDSVRRTRGANRKYKDSYIYDSYGNNTLHIDPLGNHFNYLHYILDQTDQGLSNDFYVVDKVEIEWSSYEATIYAWYHDVGLPHPHLRLLWKKEMIDPIEYAITDYEDYDDYGNCRKITAPEGNITEFSYDDIFEDGEWYYSGNHGFWTKKRVVYTPIKFFNDHGYSTKPGLLIKSRNPNGQITRYTEYDWLGRVKKIKRSDDSSPSIKFFYNDETGNKSSEIWRYFDSSDKYSTLYRFDDFDRVFQRNKIDLIYPGYDTLSTEYTHTFMDKTASGTSPKGTKTLTFDYDYTKYYKYDAIGRLKELIQPFEEQPTEGMRGYSGTDKLKTLYNYSILNSNFSYTINGHTVTLTYAEKTTITDPRGKKKDFIYDANGQLRAVREINGSDTLTTYYDYDFRGRLTAIKDAKGREVTYSYDFRGNLIERDHFDLDNPETFTYNKNAMLTKKTKPDSMAIRYEYDRINRLTKVNYGSAGETTVVDDFEGTFNWHSRPISNKCHLNTDAHNGSYSMKVDILVSAQFAVREIDDDWSLFDSLTLWYKFPQDPVYPERIIQVLVWDSNEDYISSAQIVQVDTVWHRLALDLNDEDFDKSDIDSTAVKVFKSETRGGGRVSENVLVDDIQVKSAKFTKVTYKYDSYDAEVTPPTGLNYPKNHLTKMTDESGWTMYFYDKRGRLGEKWIHFTDITSDTFKVHYTYNKADQITNITYPGDVTVGYQYDEFGRTKIVSGLSTTLATITYDPNSRDSIINYGNGVVSKFFYYPTEWTKSINTSHEEDAIFINNSYEYDSTGNRISEDAGLSALYNYDDLSRLTYERHWEGVPSYDYTYDAVGNRDSVNLVNYIYYPGTNRLKTVGIITYYYDENGNITDLSSGTSIEYNYRDMPTKITESEETIYTFSYNGDGLRVKKHRQTGGDIDAQQAQPSENYYFVHDENGNVLCDIDKEGSIKARYIYANGKHIAKIEGSNKYYYHPDPLGSPLVITKGWPYQTIAKEYKYKAFGEMKYESGTYDNTHKFTGKELDGSGLYYYGARYYDKSLGRWITPDPASMPSDLRLNDPQSFNPYVYCWNNPLNRIDKDGNFGITLGIASLVATGVGIAVTTDYLVQWKKSGKSIKEFYKSGEYPVTREGTVAILGGITGWIGGEILGSGLQKEIS